MDPIYPKLITDALSTVIYPGNKKNLVENEMVADNIRIDGRKVSFSLIFPRDTDPFIQSTVKAAEATLKYQLGNDLEVTINKEYRSAPRPTEDKLLPEVKNIIAVSSGKGGVGKSTVAANLAIALAQQGYRVGLLDTDIFGPSMPKMFGVEGYLPDAERIDGEDCILPADAMGIKLMSIGFFIKPTDALLWRGAMAVSALKQMIHQTRWGTLDFLLTDLPPGTGDVHLSIIGELKIDAAVIVSTPQQIAVADVVRGVEMFRNENVNIPVAGIVENMAWFTPAELPENRYYIFGRGGARAYAEKSGVEFLGEIPIIQSIMDGADAGTPAAGIDSRVEEHYRGIAEKIVGKVMKNG